MYTNIGHAVQSMSNSLAFCFPFLHPFCSFFVSLYLLGTLLAVIGSCPPRSQVARKLISPFPHSTPYTPHSEILTPWGFPELNIQSTKTTSRIWVTRSSTLQINTAALHKYSSSIYTTKIWKKLKNRGRKSHDTKSL